MAVAQPTSCAGVSCGSAGYTTALKNQSRTMLRIRLPRTPKTKPRLRTTSLAKARWRNLASLWAQMGETDVAAWYSFAPSGVPYINCLGDSGALSAFAAFARVNLPLLAIEHTPLTTPPTTTAVTAISGATWTIGANPTVLTLDALDQTPGPDEVLILYATKALPRGTTKIPSSIGKIFAATAATPPPIAAGDNYALKYAALQSGQVIAVRTKILNVSNGSYSNQLETLLTCP